MQKEWPALDKPPIILAIFQLKFSKALSGDLEKMIRNDKNMRKFLPIRKDNFHSNIGVQGTPAPGVSMLKAKADTKINAYTYHNESNKKKLIIQNDSITFVDEEEYLGWELFKYDVEKCIELLNEQLKDCEVNRTSIRFINKFNIIDFGEPLEYFTQTISTDSEISYPLNKFSYKLNFAIPDTDIVSTVNHALEPYADHKVYYYLDIDVLDHNRHTFDTQIISSALDSIRNVKNTIFFDTVKQKTIDLCN